MVDYFEEVREAPERGEDVNLRLRHFQPARKSQRPGRNPKTGEKSPSRRAAW